MKNEFKEHKNAKHTAISGGTAIGLGLLSIGIGAKKVKEKRDEKKQKEDVVIFESNKYKFSKKK